MPMFWGRGGMHVVSDSKKKAKGTLRNNRIKKTPEVELIEDISAPSELSEAAKKEWDEIAPTLFKNKMLTITDRKLLMAYCTEMAKYMAFNKEMELSGAYMLPLKSAKGLVVNYMQNPLMGMADKALTAAKNIGVHFGLTPMSRGKLNIPDKPSDNPEERAKNALETLRRKSGKLIKMVS